MRQPIRCFRCLALVALVLAPSLLLAQAPLFTFNVISDVHCGESPREDVRFLAALEDLGRANPKAAALCVVGDLVETSTEANYDRFNACLAKVPHPPVYAVLGNHDVRWLKGGYPEAIERFKRRTGMPGAYFDRWIEGHHFIFLGTDEDLKDAASLGPVQLAWLEARLAERAERTKPIFVFLHQPLVRTTAGTYPEDGYTTEYPDGVVQDAQLRNVLGRYPQVLFFTGHTHATVESPEEVHRKTGFACVNTAATAYTIGKGAASQGLCVDVYRNKVVVKGRSFAERAWSTSATIALP